MELVRQAVRQQFGADIQHHIGLQVGVGAPPRTLVRLRAYFQSRITSAKNKVRWIVANYNADRTDLFSPDWPNLPDEVGTNRG